MGFFNRRKQEIRADTVGFEDSLLQALLGTTRITKQIAMQIPTVASAISLLGSIVSSTPIKLYKEIDGKAIEIKDDQRITLLNSDTGDTLNSSDFWRAMVRDYYMGKGGYAYIKKEKNKFKSVHYIDETYITINKTVDLIFKDYDIAVSNGSTFKPFDFIKLLRNSTDGAQGVGIITENSKILEVAYESLIFENNLVKKGGNKKGFLQSKKRLDNPGMITLQKAWKNLYSNDDSENVVILNDGVEFKESSNTSVEMQLNENKETNSKEIGKIFHMSPSVINGNATEAEISSFVKLAVIPLFKAIECSLNRDFLLEKEKKFFYWAFDTKELFKGNIKDRYEAYGIAIEKKIMTPNEARFAEDLPYIDGMDVISMGLADVIYDINTKTYFTPNTKQITRNGVTPASNEEVPPIDGTITSEIKEGG